MSKSDNRQDIIRRPSGSNLGKVWGRSLVSVLILVGVVVVSSFTATSALAAPGEPAEPTVFFEEGFENGVGADPMLLTDYEGANGQKYTADQPWLQNCNGAILAFNTLDSALTGPVLNNCGTDRSQPETEAFGNLRQLAGALGWWNGREGFYKNLNHALTAYTAGQVGANLVNFRTVQPIEVPGGAGKYVAFSVDTAAVDCDGFVPEYEFFLVQEDGAEVPIGGTKPCASRFSYLASGVGGVRDKLVAVGVYNSDVVLLTGSSVGIVVRNANGAFRGHHVAFDNFRILDVTPQLDKEFGPAQVATGGVSTLTYTVTNTEDLIEKAGWGFTDTLPEGLTFLPLSLTGGTCQPKILEVEGGSRITVSGGDLPAAEGFCTITVQVTSNSPAQYFTGPDNATVTGLNLPGDTTVTFSGPSIPSMDPPKTNPRVEEPRVEEPRVEEPRVEEPRVEAPHVGGARPDGRAGREGEHRVLDLPREYWKDVSMRLIATMDGKVWLVGPGAPVHVLNPHDLRLLRRVLDSSPASPDTFTPGQRDVIDWYVRKLTENSDPNHAPRDAMIMRAKGGKVYLAGPGGVVHILNPNHLRLIEQVLAGQDPDGFPLAERDVLGRYGQQLGDSQNINARTIMRTTDGKLHLAGSGGIVHILNPTDLRLLERYLASTPGSAGRFTAEEQAVILRYVKQFTARGSMSSPTFMRTTDRRVHLVGPGGVLHVLNPNDLGLLQRYLKSRPGKVNTFTPRQKDIINGYLTRIG